uniref:secretion-regulating guanine nucleotide exchange factor isoform X2 n=1 Tax=Doryrhamphus excisus TaxID=161450 RepID=UPI0025AE1A53|nr:secretion-regulating guanine nucleotide exchange factor isoform X2 [Doryrhamphus excisus]
METNRRLEFCLLAWGANSYGQHGQGDEEDQAVPRLSNTAPLHGRTVRTVSGGGGHTVVLTDSGKLLSCGSNVFGQLGIGHTVKQSAELVLVQGLKERVVSVAAGLRHSLAVTDSKCVYQWGTGLYRLAKRALSPDPVPSHLNTNVPLLVPGMDQKMAHFVTAGSAHCVCLTGDGDLFLWGSNKHGQITATEPFLCTPTQLKCSSFGGEKVVNVWSGWTHLAAQMVSGRVFTWGRGDYGQLGRPLTSPLNREHQSADGESQILLPAEVKILCGATQIACGSEHNLAIVGGHLLSWGWNEHGMSGDGSLADVLEPQLLPGLTPFLIGCGAGHSMAVCAGKTSKDDSAHIPLTLDTACN